MKKTTFWVGGIEVGPDGRPVNAPTADTQTETVTKAEYDTVVSERDSLREQLDAARANAGTVTLPDDLEGKIAALKSVTKASATEVMGVIREALGIKDPAASEPE
ncbi:hypothetical protein [Deinococcus kurensis]|uniref:hypothetical protein n=1 Tax=Deinococcus kurensis TaxID=2662757 RepID=UPI0012D2D950|nr:hypothetical protein [Deinococcus kurensis]